MHELSIAMSVVEAVRARTEDRRVTEVTLRVGRLAGVVPGALDFSFGLATAGTPLEGCVLRVTQPEGRAHCRGCGADFSLPDLVLLCPCGSADVELTGGDELEIASVQVEEDAPCAAPADAASQTSG